MKKNKYKSIKTAYKGTTFHSRKEARYAAQLDLLIRAGVVLRYERQVKFPYLLFAQKVQGGELIQVGKPRAYMADFVVHYTNGTVEVVDVKGYQTKEFKEKEKIMKSLFKIDIKKI